MIIPIMILLAAAASNPATRTPLTPEEKVVMYDLTTETTDLIREFNAYQQNMQMKYKAVEDRLKSKLAEYRKTHHAEGCSLSAKQEWEGCKDTEDPAKK